MYYVIKNDKLFEWGDSKEYFEFPNNAKELAGVSMSEFNTAPEKYILENNKLVPNPQYKQEQARKEQERIAQLNLTAADVERAIYRARGMDFDDVVALVENSRTSEIDVKALKIELRANNFYRGNPYIDAVGTLLGFTKTQLDEFFETNDYTKLLTESEVKDEMV